MEIVSLFLVGLLWGVTNPFIRRSSKSIEKIDTGSKCKDFLLEAKSILTRVHYWIPFLLNQCGSVLFVWALQHSPLTAAVPIANSLSFAFTAITGYMLGEKLPGKKIIFGSILVCLGSALIMYDKVLNEQTPAIDVNFNTNIPRELLR